MPDRFWSFAERCVEPAPPTNPNAILSAIATALIRLVVMLSSAPLDRFGRGGRWETSALGDYSEVICNAFDVCRAALAFRLVERHGFYATGVALTTALLVPDQNELTQIVIRAA